MSCQSCNVATAAKLSQREHADSTLVLLTVEEAAHRLRIGRTVCFRLIKSGDLESVRVGRLRRVPADAIPTYVSRLRQSTFRQVQEVVR